MEAYTTTDPVDLKLVQSRQRWLRVKRMTVLAFTQRINEGHPADEATESNTSSRWFSVGRTPQRLQLKRVLAVFPDWPH